MADTHWKFGELAKEGNLPILRFDVDGEETTGRSKYFFEEEGLKLRTPKDRHGTFSGAIPSVAVASSHKAWKISATLSLPQSEGAGIRNAFPNAGIVVFSGKKDYIALGTTFHAGQNKDFFEIRSSNAKERVRINSFNTPYPADVARHYTLSIEMDADGKILFGYSNGERAEVLLTLEDGGGIPASKAGIIDPDGRPFKGEPHYDILYDSLKTLAGKQIGFFVDGHLYSVENPDKLEYSVLFNEFKLEGITLEKSDE